MYDFLIIGQGIAGSLLAYTAIQKGYSVFIIDQYNPNSSSNVAIGGVNPVTGRKMVKTWRADEFIPFSIKTYKQIEAFLNIQLIHEVPFSKVIPTEDFIEIWTSKLKDSEYCNYLTPIEDNQNPNIIAPYGIGFIQQAYWMEVKIMIDAFRSYFTSNQIFANEIFEHSKLEIGDTFKYKNITAKNIIFCEGYKVSQNPFFNFIPLVTAKGEQLQIHCPELKLQHILNKNIFIVPLGNDFYRVGSTYIWNDTTEKVTQDGKAELLDKLNRLISCNYTIVNEVAGIRPAMKDRRPAIGGHPSIKSMYLFNGFGTKGISLAPFFANELLLHITSGKELDNDVSISRFI